MDYYPTVEEMTAALNKGDKISQTKHEFQSRFHEDRYALS